MENRRKKLELYEKILLKLDLKDLLRFKSVCHGWRDLISSSQFINRHLQLSTMDREQNHHRVFSTYPLMTIDYKYFGFYVESKLWNKIIDKPLPLPYPRDSSSDDEVSLETLMDSSSIGVSLEIMGSCDGLICLLKLSYSSGSGNEIIVWNPFLQESVNIPLPFDSCLTGFYWFGRHDGKNGKKGYKVVLSNTRKIYELNSKSNSNSNDDIGLYNWYLCDEIPVEQMCVPTVMGKRGTFLNGNIHWPIVRKRRIFSYNLSIHKFCGGGGGGFRPPSVIREGSCFTLKVFNGCLGAICKPKMNFEIWVMKEYGVKESWIRLTKLEGFGADAKILRVLGTLKNGDLIMDVDQKTLQRYYFNGNTPRIVKTRLTNNTLSDAISYVESLISPIDCIRLPSDHV